VKKSNPDFSTVPTALGNPATDAGFPHFPSHDGGGYRLPLKTKPAKIAGPVRFLRRAGNRVRALETDAEANLQHVEIYENGTEKVGWSMSGSLAYLIRNAYIGIALSLHNL
jgi:hypothetical protein